VPYKEEDKDKKKPPIKATTTPGNAMTEIQTPVETVEAPTNDPNKLDIPMNTVEPIDIQPANIEIQSTQPKDYSGDITNLEQDIINRQMELKKQGLRDQFQDTQQAVSQAQEGLGRTFAQQRGTIRTEGQMANKRASVGAAAGGLQDSGAMAQTQAMSSMATRGSLAQSRQQENEIRQQLNNKILEARQNMQRGISDANTEAEIAQLENELGNVQAMQEQEIARAKAADERAFKLQEDQNKFLQDVQLTQIENALEQQNMAIEAEIENAMANNDFIRESQLLEQKAENDARLAAINNSARMSQIQAQGANNIALQEQRAADEMAQIEAKGQSDLALQESEGTTANVEVLEENSKPYIGFIDDIVNTVTSEIERRGQGKIYSPQQKINAATPQIVSYLQNLEASGVDERVIDHLLSRYGLSLGK
jgi:hypothetical protein